MGWMGFPAKILRTHQINLTDDARVYAYVKNYMAYKTGKKYRLLFLDESFIHHHYNRFSHSIRDPLDKLDFAGKGKQAGRK